MVPFDKRQVGRGVKQGTFDFLGFTYTVFCVALVTSGLLIGVVAGAWIGYANVWDWIKTGQRVRSEEAQIKESLR